ncbi:MAG: hypothetical protein KC910_00200 [Candidatus Eremiobacteraeota bacterium]|nr:hypothetical protein [Candidatus Eremiobacteraeota bacterium]
MDTIETFTTPGHQAEELGAQLELALHTTRAGRGCVLLYGRDQLRLAAAIEDGQAVDEPWPDLDWQLTWQAWNSNDCLTNGSTLAVCLSDRAHRYGVLYLEQAQPERLLAVEGLAWELVGLLARDQAVLHQRQLDRCQASNRALTQQVIELQRVNGELQRFVHLAANHLQEPLRALDGYSRMVQAHVSDPAAKVPVTRIQEAARRLTSVVSDLLDYSKPGSTSFVPVNLDAVIGQARSDLQAEMQACQARLSRDRLGWAAGDASALRLVFRNLLSNALKFRRGCRPRIHIGCRELEDSIELTFIDDGIGLPGDRLEEVFEPFRRLHTLEEFPGTGLGLTIARSIVERHGGRLWLESNHFNGTTAHLLLPSRPAR